MSTSDPHAAPAGPAGPETQHESTISVLERPEESYSPGDNERYAHYVRKDRITQSLVEGTPVVALCGKVWIPVRNPDRFPLCPTCKEIYAKLGKGGGDSWPFGPGTPSN